MSLAVSCEENTIINNLIQVKEKIIGQVQNKPKEMLIYCDDKDKSQSIVNFLHYQAFNELDTSLLDKQLIELGLSSPKHWHTQLMFNIDQTLAFLNGDAPKTLLENESISLGPSAMSAQHTLTKNKNRFFSTKDSQRHTAIMVTLPAEAAWNEELLTDLLNQGMNCARIDCSTHDKSIWRNMINHLNSAKKRTDKPCKLFMDLPAPTLRTIIQPSIHNCISIKPEQHRHKALPTPIVFYSEQSPPPVDNQHDIDYFIRVSSETLQRFQVGDRLFFIDANNKKCFINMNEHTLDKHWIGLCWKKATLNKNTMIELQRTNQDDEYETLLKFNIDLIQMQPTTYKVQKKDCILLLHDTNSTPPFENSINISCSSPEVINSLNVGQEIWFDEGKIGAYVEKLEEYGVKLRITHTKKNGSKLRTNRKINIPGAKLNKFIQEDASDIIEFSCQHADLVGISSIENRQQLGTIIDELKNNNATHIGVIIKLARQITLNHIEEILESALPHNDLAIMFDNNELLIELGALKLAKLRTKVLPLFKSAHLPVVDSENLLGSLIKNGKTKRLDLYRTICRDEDCILLDQGPHLLPAVVTLDTAFKSLQKTSN